jgi:hypothetical protein
MGRTIQKQEMLPALILYALGKSIEKQWVLGDAWEGGSMLFGGCDWGYKIVVIQTWDGTLTTISTHHYTASKSLVNINHYTMTGATKYVSFKLGMAP